MALGTVGNVAPGGAENGTGAGLFGAWSLESVVAILAEKGVFHGLDPILGGVYVKSDW